MKKILSSVAAIALAAALISCGDSGDTNNNITNSDTIISVGTPVVTGKAYPGVNYITWTPVANASYYEVYRTVNNASELVAGNVTGKLEYADFAKANASSDFALVDGVTYQYTIYAVGANSVNVPSRAVYIATSTASTYVKATVPAYGTDITKFEDQTTKDYLAKLAKGEGVTKPALLDSTTFAQGTYNVSFAYPVIPGYKYAVNLVKDDYVSKGVDLTNNQKKATAGWTVNFNGTYTANGGKIAKGSGKYTAYLTVAALSPLYTTDAVYALGPIEIADIGELSNTTNVKASYSDEKNVVVTWTPAKLKSTGADTPVANYRVFRASSADDYNTLTQIDTATNKVFVAEKETAYQTTINGQVANVSTLYAIKDTVTDNKVTYRYYAVHTNGTLYGKEADFASLTAYSNVNGKTAAPALSVTTIKADASHIYDTFKIVATPNNANRFTNNLSKVTEIAYVKLDDDTAISVNKEKVYDPSAFTALKLENSNLSDGSYIAYLEAKDGTYLFRAKAEEAGKDAEYSYKTIVMAASANAGTLNKSYTYWSEVNTTTGAVAIHNVVAVTETASNEIGAYTYEWFYVDTTTVNTNYGDKVTVTTSSLTKATPVKVTSDSSKALQTLGVGNYGFVIDYTAPTYSGDTVISRQYFVKKSNANNSAVYGIR